VIETGIAGPMYDVERNLNFHSMKVNSARILLGLAFPQGQVSICLKGNQQVQTIIETIINGSRY